MSSHSLSTSRNEEPNLVDFALSLVDDGQRDAPEELESLVQTVVLHIHEYRESNTVGEKQSRLEDALEAIGNSPFNVEQNSELRVLREKIRARVDSLK